MTREAKPDLDLQQATVAVEAIGCCVSQEYSQFVSVRDTIQYFTQYCTSDDFASYLTSVGLQNPSFRHNGFLLQECQALNKFRLGWGSMKHGTVIGLAFHGTASGNIESILRDGLDPRRRKGQSYGAGEYFSKEPVVSVSFCKGGLEMLVFAVVLSGSIKKAGCPPDYVVQENNQHQIPIGTIKYSAVDSKVIRRSQQRRQTFSDMRKKLHQQANLAKEALAKATIIQYLITDKVDLASELYQRKSSILTQLSKREISMYVHRFIDEDVVFYLFPDLPPPMSAADNDTAKITNADLASESVAKLCQEIEAEEAALFQRTAKQKPPPQLTADSEPKVLHVAREKLIALGHTTEADHKGQTTSIIMPSSSEPVVLHVPQEKLVQLLQSTH